MSDAPRVSISPEPTIEEARPQVVLVEQRARESRWRFSGRWWSTPLPQRRPRP